MKDWEKAVWMLVAMTALTVAGLVLTGGSHL